MHNNSSACDLDVMTEAARQLLQRPALLSPDMLIKDRVVLCALNLGSGGAERQIVMTVEGLGRRGWDDLHLLAVTLQNESDRFYLPLLEPGAITLHDLSAGATQQNHELDAFFPEITAILEPLPQANRDAFFAYLRALHTLRPSVLHVWMDFPEAALAGCLLGIPRVVLSWQNSAPYHFLYCNPGMLPQYRALQDHPAMVFSNNSQAGRDDYAAWIGLDPEKIFVLYNGIDPALWKRPAPNAVEALKNSLGIAPGNFVVGALSRLAYEKDPELWIRAARAIADRRQDVTFVLFGEGPLLDVAKQSAEACGMSAAIRFPGPTREAALAHGLLDVFLMTSRMEGLPNVLLEAQLLGVPVVTTKAGGTTEAIHCGKTGLAVEQRNASLLADAVCRILEDRAWRDDCRRLGPDFVAGKFGISAMIDATLHVYGW